MPEDITLERGRPLTDAELASRADWIRLQTIDLIAQAGLGHYSSTFSCRGARRDAVLPRAAAAPERAALARPGPVPARQGPRGHRAVAGPRRPRLLPAGLAQAVRQGRLAAQRPPEHEGGAAASTSPPAPSGTTCRSAPAWRSPAGCTGRDYRTFVLTGDGELQEGQVWEAAMAASHYKLGNLVAIVDANGFSGAGPTSQAMNIEPLGKRFEAFGWTVREIDGHDAPTLQEDVRRAAGRRASEQPVAVIARTRKGHGVEFMEKQPQAWHLACSTPSSTPTWSRRSPPMDTERAGAKGARSEPVARADREEDGRRLLRRRPRHRA